MPSVVQVGSIFCISQLVVTDLGHGEAHQDHRSSHHESLVWDECCTGTETQTQCPGTPLCNLGYHRTQDLIEV